MNWPALFFATVVFIAANYHYKKRAFLGKPWWFAILLSFWFFFCSLLLLIPVITLLSINFDWFVLFLLITFLWFSWPTIIRKIGRFPKKYYEADRSRFLVLFDPKITLIKYVEVLFQQVGFLYLLFMVLAGFSKEIVILQSVVIIGGSHLANFFFMPKKWALFYFKYSHGGSFSDTHFSGIYFFHRKFAFSLLYRA